MILIILGPSLLPSLSKILERAIHNQLYMYLNENRLLANCQSGFRPLYSTATCLTEITDYLLDKMDQGNVIGGIFLDLRKAFDVIPHNFILKKLAYFGIKGNEYDWIKSYLTERRQFVTVNNCISDYLCPTRIYSRTADILYVYFMNDICYLKLHAHSKMSLYLFMPTIQLCLIMVKQ